MQAPLAAHSLADLPRDPRTWLPAEVSIYLFHVFANVPVPVMETLAHFVASAHLTGRAFLRLRERDLEQKGMNTRWRRLLCEASRRLRRDALRRRIWSGREDEWSGSDDGGLDRPRDAEQTTQGSQLAHGEKRVMTITLKRIQNRKYVKDAIQGLEPSAAEELQPIAVQTKPRRKETASWPHTDAEGYKPSREVASPPFGQGYVRGRVTSLTSQAESDSATTRHRRGKDAFSQSYTVNSMIGPTNDAPEVPSESPNVLSGVDRADEQGFDWSAPATAPFTASEEGSVSLVEAEEEMEDVLPWSPLEQGLIDAILEAELSRFEETDLFDTSKASSISSASILADEVDYDPVKPTRLSTSMSGGNLWRKTEIEDNETALPETGHGKNPGDYSAANNDSKFAHELIDGDEETSCQDTGRITDVVTEEGSSDEDRYQDSPDDESAGQRIPSPTVGRHSSSYFYSRTLSKASTRSNNSFLSALDGRSSDTIRSDYATASRCAGSLSHARCRQGVPSVATLFGLGIAEVELESSEDTVDEFEGSNLQLSLDLAELSPVAVLDVESGEEGEEGRLDDPAEETEYISSTDTTEHSTTTDSQGVSSSEEAPPLAPSSEDATPSPTDPAQNAESEAPDGAASFPSSWQTLLRSTLDQLQYVRGCMGLHALPAYAVALGIGAAVVLGRAVLKEVVGRRGARG